MTRKQLPPPQHSGPSIDTSTRETARKSLISWLQWNDANGTYTDAQNRSEGYKPLTLTECIELYVTQIERD